MARERELRVKIVGDSSDAQRAFKDVDRAGAQTEKNVGSMGRRVGPLIAAGFAVGAGAAAVELFKLGASLEQQRAKAEIVFGPESIKMVDAWAKDTAHSLGLTKSEAVNLAAGLQDLLVPLDFTRENAAKMSTDVVKLAGALSQWSGGTRSTAEVTEILRDALLGERDALKGLGVQIEAEEINQVLLNKGQQDLTGTAKQQAEAVATLELAHAKSKDAIKAAGDETTTTAEKMTQANAQFREAKELVGTGLVGALNAYIGAAEKAGEASVVLEEKLSRVLDLIQRVTNIGARGGDPVGGVSGQITGGRGGDPAQRQQRSESGQATVDPNFRVNPGNVNITINPPPKSDAVWLHDVSQDLAWNGALLRSGVG